MQDSLFFVERVRNGKATIPDEDSVMQVASLWSIDPTTLDEQFKEPLMGLLGTVISMIGTFNEIGKAAQGGGGAGVAGSADKIGLALFATMLGLATAIPLVFTHVLLKDWIYRQELKMKTAGQKLIMIVQNTKPGSVPPDEDQVGARRPEGAPRGGGAARPVTADRGRRG